MYLIRIVAVVVIVVVVDAAVVVLIKSTGQQSNRLLQFKFFISVKTCKLPWNMFICGLLNY